MAKAGRLPLEFTLRGVQGLIVICANRTKSVFKGDTEMTHTVFIILKYLMFGSLTRTSRICSAHGPLKASCCHHPGPCPVAVVRPPRSFSVTSTRTVTTAASDPLHLLLPPRPRPRSGLPSIRMLRARQQVLTPPPSDPLILQPQVRGLSVQTQRRVPEIQHHPAFTP